MENYLNLMIIGATRYDIDGNRGGSLWAYSPAEADDENRVGNEVMKIACDYKHIDQLRNHANRLPAMFTVKAQMKAGAQGKVTFKALELKPQEPAKKPAA
ncbi:hypothetical protein [Marinobacter sp. CA1]|uniref:hypothetical protein n=1 Tax=Marinobacter sp. CA1 TaxID=2817656 RepID=UPI001D06B21B|nr:hypothetical protein [Marinobacter sp. CA1]MCG8517322.1 hypothetical protein [Pseudomonadales bacterium]UDL05734.1 hypothetical protein J2887_02895 [Marinobacter sp. CA1]